jgi:hypothetical protein
MAEKQIYLELKAIFSGCDTINDALLFTTIYCEKYPYMKSAIISFMNSYTFNDNIDIRTKQSRMKHIYLNIQTKEDAQEYVSHNTESMFDDIYTKIINMIINKKPKKIYKERIKNITKACPHCKHMLSAPIATQYIICGYHNNIEGYDWYGCGKDSCFQCGKILCKRWETDMLCLNINRQHDSICCSTHATENNKIYPDDYCQCIHTTLHKLLY